MKRFLPSIIWFVAGALLGQLADGFLFQLWSRCGLLLPIAHWFNLHGGNTMAKCWFILWVNATSWFLAGTVGILGGAFVKRHLVRYLLVFGLGYALVPLAIDYCLNSDIPSVSWFGWRAVSVVLVLLCGLLAHRRNQLPNPALEATAAARSA